MDFKHFQCSLKSCFDKEILPQEKLIRILGDHKAFIEMTISDLKSAKGSNFWVLSVQILVFRGQCLRKRSDHSFASFLDECALLASITVTPVLLQCSYTKFLDIPPPLRLICFITQEIRPFFCFIFG